MTMRIPLLLLLLGALPLNAATIITAEFSGTWSIVTEWAPAGPQVGESLFGRFGFTRQADNSITDPWLDFSYGAVTFPDVRIYESEIGQGRIFASGEDLLCNSPYGPMGCSITIAFDEPWGGNFLGLSGHTPTGGYGGIAWSLDITSNPPVGEIWMLPEPNPFALLATGLALISVIVRFKNRG